MRGHDAVTGRLVSRQFTHEMWRLFAGRLGEGSLAAAVRQLTRWQRSVTSSLGPASGLTAIHDVAGRRLFRILGFEMVRSAEATRAGVLVSIVSGRRTGPLPLIVGSWTDRLDALTRRGVQEAVDRGARWALCFNGRALRLADADRPYARRFLDFDLSEPVLAEDTARVLWAMLRACALERRPGTGDTLLDALVGASDRHAGRVADSLQLGVREALEALALSIRRTEPRRRTAPPAIVEQSLTIVYRLLFLLFAEARSLVPMWNPIYRDSYSLDGLREACDRPAEAVGLWEALQAISRLAHEGCSTRDLRVTAFNSQLFSPERAPLVERTRVDDETMARVLRALTDRPAPMGAARIAYADLGVEQLGTIYERLLDVTPALEVALARPLERGRVHERAGTVQSPRSRAERVSVRRKESGTFYTPRPLAEFVVRETLAPLVRDASLEEILQLRVLDPAMGSGAFLVAACRFLADACADALAREHPTPAGGDTGRERARLRRLVAQRCLYGVDLNPVAVQLARLSLWLATLAADAPLTFLDHHLSVGDSLVGATIDDLMRGWPSAGRARARPDPRTPLLFDGSAVTELMGAVIPARHRLAGPDDTVDAVRIKEQALAQSLSTGELSRWMALADLWCARWFWNGPGGAPPASAWHALGDYILEGRSALPSHVAERSAAQARETAHERRFLHWSLRFPEVFFDAEGRPRLDGGFDAIVGNPPWDMVRGDAGDAPLRQHARRSASALSRFVRESRLHGRGRDAHLNRYQLFVERALVLARRGGRLGLIVPWGLATDVASAPLRRALFERCDTDTLVAFENTEGVFPIHRSVRFMLVMATTGRPTTRIACRIGERSPDTLDRAVRRGAARGTEPVVLTPTWLRRVSGESLELPYVRDARDVALLDRLHARWPAMGSVDGWAAVFGRELNATDDRALFEPGTDGMPVVDGRHVSPFVVHANRSGRVVPWSRVPVLAGRLPSIARPRLAYRDVASATNRVTLIAAVLPPHVVTTHTLFCLKSALDSDAQQVLCALMNSLVANYLIRLRVTTHVTVALVSRLPVPRPVRESPAFISLADCARTLQLAARESRPTGRSQDAGACERSPAWVRLQAIAAREYGLDSDELEYVLSTFPLVDATARREVVRAAHAGW